MTPTPTQIKVKFTEQHEAKLQALAPRINKLHCKLAKYFAKYELLFIYAMFAFFGGEKLDVLNDTIKQNTKNLGCEKAAFLSVVVMNTTKYLDFVKELKQFEDDML